LSALVHSKKSKIEQGREEPRMNSFLRVLACYASGITKFAVTSARLFLLATLLIGAATAARAQDPSSTTTVTATPNPAAVGQSVTFTATVSSPGGNVTGGLGVSFFYGSPDDPVTVPVEGGPETGTASLTVSFPTTGTRTVTAAFNGVTGGASASNDTVDMIVTFAGSTTTVVSSPNPSAAGEEVTFTATVTSLSGGDVTGGLGVTFFDGGELLDTVLVTGGPTTGTATLTVPLSTVGDHVITAAFNGTQTVSASNSTVTQSVGTAGDSLDLRAMQIVATREVALTSGRAFSGAVESAISDGLGGLGQSATMSLGGLRLAYGPESQEAELGWPGGGGGQGGDWQVWADLRTAGVGDWSADSDDEDLSGLQFNALLGVTHRIGDNLLVGLLGGYERFDYNSDTLDADLDGDGWTIGGYVGGRIAERLRFHAAAGYSGIGYDSSAGTADGSFDANRWIVTGGLSGDVEMSTSWSSRR
jgi:hypothetical protein